MAKIPCFLCSEELPQRNDKNRKPYFVCDPCGIQIFVRGRQGVKNLAQLMKTLAEREFPFRQHARVLYEIQAVLTEIRGIKKELSGLDSIFDVLANDKDRRDKKRMRKSLNDRLEALMSALEQIAQSNVQSR